MIKEYSGQKEKTARRSDSRRFFLSAGQTIPKEEQERRQTQGEEKEWLRISRGKQGIEQLGQDLCAQRVLGCAECKRLQQGNDQEPQGDRKPHGEGIGQEDQDQRRCPPNHGGSGAFLRLLGWGSGESLAGEKGVHADEVRKQ